MKKFPSRKIRGRIRNVAFVCSGRPWSSIVIVTSAAAQRERLCAYRRQPGTPLMLCTFPTLTPAIRTSESGRRPLALEKMAWTVNGLANGLANFVNARYVSRSDHDDPDRPGLERADAPASAPAFHWLAAFDGS